MNSSNRGIVNRIRRKQQRAKLKKQKRSEAIRKALHHHSWVESICNCCGQLFMLCETCGAERHRGAGRGGAKDLDPHST